jgi:hypothetical protein
VTEKKPDAVGQWQAVANTDRELWRERDDYYADSIHVTEGGGIGINVGGTVFVMPLKKWHDLARHVEMGGESAQPPTGAQTAEQFYEGWWKTRMDLLYASPHDVAIAFAEAYAASLRAQLTEALKVWDEHLRVIDSLRATLPPASRKEKPNG